MATASKGIKRAMKAANVLHAAVYRASGGRFASKMASMPVLLITTFGRKMGNSHTNPGLCLEHRLTGVLLILALVSFAVGACLPTVGPKGNMNIFTLPVVQPPGVGPTSSWARPS